MSAYLRRLWAALLGRQYMPLDVHDLIFVRWSSTPVRIVTVTQQQDRDGVRISVEAQSLVQP